MKIIKTLIGLLFFGSAITYAQVSSVQEVYIMGTMHTVPKIVKHSYKPLLKNSIKYQPDAIYVESPRANDSLSWAYLKDGWSKAYKEFYWQSDSIRKVFEPSKKEFYNLTHKDINHLSESDLDHLIKTFTYHRDFANFEFYSYIKSNGITGVKKPTRHEDGDLTFKLALNQNIKLLKSMDDQRTNDLYHDAWQKCAEEGRNNGNNAINNKLNKKHYNSAILPAVLGRLGKRTNNRKSLEMLHQMAAFTYVKEITPGCSEGEKYWNERNHRMAKNIAEQVMESELQKNIVIVGAAHVIGLEKELKTHYPQLKVILMDD